MDFLVAHVGRGVTDVSAIGHGEWSKGRWAQLELRTRRSVDMARLKR